MKITKKKHSELKTMLEKAMTYYFVNDNHYPMPKLCDRIIQRIQEILSDEPRSLPHHRLYFAMCNWLAGAMPEWVHEQWKIKKFTSDFVHMILKASQDIDSIAFNAMDEKAFTEYHNNCRVWICTVIFQGQVTSDQIDQMMNSA